jgi:dipeptidase D
VSTVLDMLEPQLVWGRFLDLTRIARPPKHEEAAREHVLSWASARGFSSTADPAGNLVVRVPATVGRETAPTVVLQSHLDMVCERDPESPYDPREGRINVLLEGDWLLADGTTLGADNGIGVAVAMAAADDTGLAHGPLELLFTVSEEQGLEGAKQLDPGLVSGRLLVNLDGGDEGITVGCAGSIHTFTRLRLNLEPTPAGQVALNVRVSGAKGGHSGGDIAAGRINANKALARILSRMYEQHPFRLSTLAGGVSRNAIPRDAHAVVCSPEGAVDALRGAAEQELETVRDEFRRSDPDLALSVENRPATESASETTTARALDLVAATPTGVIAMNPELRGVVETSTSLTVVSTEEDVLTLGTMTRSASPQALEEVEASLLALARLAGADMDVVRSYPPWQPELASRLLGVAQDTWRRLFETEPELVVVHGGLECAVIGGRVPGIDMISIGPEIEGPHAPGERVSVSSTQRFYLLLGALLDDLSR